MNISENLDQITQSITRSQELKLRAGKSITDDDAENKKETKNEKIERFLSTEFEFRFNDIKQKPEYKSEFDHDFVPVDKYYLNTLKRKLDGYGITTSTENIRSIIESEFSERINPIQKYFIEMQPYTSGEPDYIRQLCNTVQLKNPDQEKHWYTYFKKWIVGVVANALDNEICRNHLCLVLTGPQGTFKTTWLENLCPKALKQYLFTGKIDPTNKDTLTYLAEFLFINIDDQLRQLNKKDENELKNLITVNKVKYRRPYDVYLAEYPHLASFMASVNGNDFLTDPTGSRRFLPFEVESIDIRKAQQTNMDHIYRQAYQLYRDKFDYWLNEKEVLELHEHNSSFQVISVEEELLLEYFTIPAPETHKQAANVFLTSAMVKTYIEKQSQQRLSSKKLGEALTKVGAIKWQKTENNERKWVYSLIKKTEDTIYDQNKNPEHESNQFPT